ncbi:MAG: autotransporter outer membrane beta-barrel domain-containing protein [Dialister sp.]|nr:autotransporter outer membrane beta-barrel domain-containing protein [Dialister sp.]MDY2811968.1 autotransporter outer membrane beta-barrel domain-containing protein [Dialister sp.]MDY4472259.1 autotransporter outer membrane beta-barrel domain-containing protein [Dialister sp.]MDY4679615.1 autotransporter outer membrane beta-barrel domain-containing protein [Dialister sp.]MDY4957705.1 autotransporter outer membrane beta-barrel domain-containing protein [Dialister sp.]
MGNPNAKKICIDVKNEGTAKAKAVVATDVGGSKIDITAKDVSISASSAGAIGVFSLNEGSSISIKGGSVSVTATGEEAAALQVQNNTQDKNAPTNASSVAIDADNITVTSDHIGIASFSNGQMNINGNLTVNAKNALDVRGHSTTNINTDGKHSTVLNGDIVFETPWTPEDGAGSGRVIDANVNVYLKGKDSSWTGSAYQEYKNHKSDTEWQHVTDMTTNADNDDTPGNVTGFKLTMADGASWNMTGDSFVNDVKASGDSTIHVGSNVKTANMQNVTLDKATIDLAGDHQTVNVTDTLSGNGTIATNSLNNKLTAADAADADITVKGSGDIADQIAGDSQVAQKLADVAANQDGRSIAKSVKTDAGVIAGEYSAQVDENGKVFNEVKSQNQTNLSISKLGALSLMTWRQENNDMNKRLGEIRDSQGEQGIWARMSRGEAKYSATGVKNQYNYYQLGYDHKIADDWILGGAFTYTDGENNLVGGSGTNKNTGFAVYGSNLRDDGSFIDLIAKYAHMKNDFDTIGGVGIGEYSTNGYALSAEYGKRFQQDGFWIEPQAELTYGKVSSADFTTSEGAKVHQDSLDSLVGRLGFSLGKDVKAGNVYVRASYLYDFKGDVAMRMSNGVASATYDQDLGGSWWEFGVGTNLNFGKDMHFYFDVERTEGGKVDTPWQWNAGVRLSF